MCSLKEGTKLRVVTSADTWGYALLTSTYEMVQLAAILIMCGVSLDLVILDYIAPESAKTARHLAVSTLIGYSFGVCHIYSHIYNSLIEFIQRDDTIGPEDCNVHNERGAN
jgi:hypothetical protein